jgi:hypothetical protein
MLTKIEKGKPYPLHNNARGIERPVIETNTSFFDILLYSLDAKSDAKFWGKSPVKIYPVILDSIPIVVVRYPKEGFDFDVSMNFHKVHAEQREDWLSNDGNLISLVLIDAKTNFVHGLRLLGVDFSAEFRSACKEQLRQYNSSFEIDTKIAAIQARYQTADLLDIYRSKQ